MLRRLLISVWAAALPCLAVIWPEQLDVHKRTKFRSFTPPEMAVWQEYGLEVAEEAEYGSWKATGYRLKDPTSAYAAYLWLKPAEGRPTNLEKVGIQTSTRAFFVKGNFLLDFNGRVPTQREVDLLHIQLPRLDQSPLPSFLIYFPAQNLIPGTERYVTGPVSLGTFENRIPASVAGFSMGGEAQVARFRSPTGEMNLTLFSYPTPQIARERLAEFQKLPGARAKRAGPLVAVTFEAPNADEAEKLLSRVNYQVAITWNERLPKPEPGVGELLLTAFTFVGLLLLFAILSGLAYAGARIVWRKWLGNEEDEVMVTLRLGPK